LLWICCGFAVQQIHEKSTANLQHLMLWINLQHLDMSRCCGLGCGLIHNITANPASGGDLRLNHNKYLSSGGRLQQIHEKSTTNPQQILPTEVGYCKSTTNPQQIHEKSTANPQQILLVEVGYSKSTTNLASEGELRLIHSKSCQWRSTIMKVHAMRAKSRTGQVNVSAANCP
jgi:hypothetical protein